MSSGSLPPPPPPPDDSSDGGLPPPPPPPDTGQGWGWGDPSGPKTGQGWGSPGGDQTQQGWGTPGSGQTGQGWGATGTGQQTGQGWGATGTGQQTGQGWGGTGGQTGWGTPGSGQTGQGWGAPGTGWGGQPGYGGPGYGGYGQRRSNGLALASMICGLVALGCILTFFLFITIPLGFMLGIAAIVTGILGLRAAREPGVGGRGQAITGLCTGIAALALLVIGGIGLIAVWESTGFESNPLFEPEEFLSELEDRGVDIDEDGSFDLEDLERELERGR